MRIDDILKDKDRDQKKNNENTEITVSPKPKRKHFWDVDIQPSPPENKINLSNDPTANKPCLNKQNDSPVNNQAKYCTELLPDNSDEANTNGVETESKRSRNGVITESKQCHNGVETESKVAEIQEFEPKNTINGVITESKRSHSKTINGVETESFNTINGVITESKRSHFIIELFSEMRGFERDFVWFIFNECQISAALITASLSIEFIQDSLSLKTRDSVKSIVKRVVKKNVVSRVSRKNGRGGSCQYGLDDTFYRYLMLKKIKRSHNGVETESFRTSNGVETESFRTSNGVENGGETISSMYVCKNNTIHTGGLDPWFELREVDFSSTDQFMIRPTVIDTFKKNKWIITREQLEEHLERFIRYFTEKEFEKRREPIKSPYSFFLSSIKAISKGEPDPICDVETQFEIIQKQAVQNKLKAMEIRRREFEANEKQMDQYRDSEFEHWVVGLADEEKVQFALPSKMAELGSSRHKLLLKDYFTQNIWPEIKQSVLVAPRS